jgi:hypothetical protein
MKEAQQAASGSPKITPSQQAAIDSKTHPFIKYVYRFYQITNQAARLAAAQNGASFSVCTLFNKPIHKEHSCPHRLDKHLTWQQLEGVQSGANHVRIH